MRNVGSLDRLIRYVATVVLAVAGFYTGGTTRIILWVGSLVSLLTAASGFCPLWAIFRINTHKKS